MTTCEYDGTAKTYNCAREEQCDDCFMIDHLKECAGCEHYDHPPMTRLLQVQHDTGERRFEAELLPLMMRLTPEELMELQADVEAKYGEERVSDND